MSGQLNNTMDTIMGNTQPQHRPITHRRRLDFQLALEIARQSRRPAPLLLEDVNTAEHPRIGPVPPTPDQPTADASLVRKRKEPPTVIQPQTPTWLKMAKHRATLRPPTTPVVAKRVGPNDLKITMKDVSSRKSNKKDVFRFLDLPGEIRNQVYNECMLMTDKQVLLVYLPKASTLRSSTRIGRSTPGRYTPPVDPEKKVRTRAVKPLPPPETHRPFVGLTQVCKQLRKEFYPLYIAKQEVGLDLAHSGKYAATFFNPKMEMCFSDNPDPLGRSMPFRGNLTIALSDKILPLERVAGYLDALPLLEAWANSARVEAGFGRYSRKRYVPQNDGEAKDLYRLYGRKVLPDRTCGEMNRNWRFILRRKHLAAIRVYRTGRSYGRPYFHIIWKYQYRQPWMTQRYSTMPDSPTGRAAPGSWIWGLGFDFMEHFDVRVGAETYPNEIATDYDYWMNRAA